MVKLESFYSTEMGTTSRREVVPSSFTALQVASRPPTRSASGTPGVAGAAPHVAGAAHADREGVQRSVGVGAPVVDHPAAAGTDDGREVAAEVGVRERRHLHGGLGPQVEVPVAGLEVGCRRDLVGLGRGGADEGHGTCDCESREDTTVHWVLPVCFSSPCGLDSTPSVVRIGSPRSLYRAKDKPYLQCDITILKKA